MKHDTWIGPVDPWETLSDTDDPVEHHVLYQRHGVRAASYKYVLSLEAARDRKIQSFMLRGARRDLRAFIAEHGHE